MRYVARFFGARLADDDTIIFEAGRHDAKTSSAGRRRLLPGTLRSRRSSLTRQLDTG